MVCQHIFSPSMTFSRPTIVYSISMSFHRSKIRARYRVTFVERFSTFYLYLVFILIDSIVHQVFCLTMTFHFWTNFHVFYLNVNTWSKTWDNVHVVLLHLIWRTGKMFIYPQGVKFLAIYLMPCTNTAKFISNCQNVPSNTNISLQRASQIAHFSNCAISKKGSITLGTLMSLSFNTASFTM